MAGYSKTYTLDFTASGDTVYTGTDKLEDNIDALITYINAIKKSYASATAPTSPAPDEGQLWWDSTNDNLYVYTGSAWSGPITDTHKVKADSGDGTEGYLNAKVQNSVVVDETNHKIHLSGDSASPGNSYMYGTDSGGTKGWVLYVPGTVKADSGDSSPDYLDGKVDDSTIEVNASDQLALKDDGITREKLLVATVGSYVEGETAEEDTFTGYMADYELMQQMIIARDGAYTIKFDMKSSLATVYGKIYKNGGAVGTEQTTASATYVTKSEDISGWEVGDLCQLYGKSNTATTLTVTKLRVCSANPIVSSPHADYA